MSRNHKKVIGWPSLCIALNYGVVYIHPISKGDTKMLDLVEIQDRSRVRMRLGLDASEWVRLLSSEVENYGEYFTPKELERLRFVMRELRALRKSCLD